METFFKQCPSCNCRMEYKQKYSLNYSIRENKLCRQCSAKNASSIFPDRGWKKLNDDIKSGKKLNGFKDKTHNEDAKLKMSQADKSYTKTSNFKKTMSNVTSGKNNGMYGKSFYDVWVEKYGTEIANDKMVKYRNNTSKKTTGSNNPMYGKISPEGSGNGWSGWYKGWYFRSILELSYMINVIERFGLNWEEGERGRYKIKYIDNKSVERTYTPDFIISGKYMIEIKPKKLWGQIDVQLKAAAANEFCISNSMIYKMTFCSKISDQEIKELVETDKLIFIERYKNKYNERYNK